MQTSVIHVVALIISVHGAAAAFSQEEPSIMRPMASVEAFQKGERLLADGRFREAIEQFNKAIEEDATFAIAFLKKGDALFEQGDFRQAFFAYQSAADRDRNLIEAYCGAGECQLRLHNYEYAASKFSEAADIGVSDPTILRRIGNIILKYNREKGADLTAIRLFSDAIDLSTENSAAYRDRALAYVRIGKFDSADADLIAAFAAEPEALETYNLASRIYLIQEKYAAAYEATTKAIEIYAKDNSERDHLNAKALRAYLGLKLAESEADIVKKNELLRMVASDSRAVVSAVEAPVEGAK